MTTLWNDFGRDFLVQCPGRKGPVGVNSDELVVWGEGREPLATWAAQGKICFVSSERGFTSTLCDGLMVPGDLSYLESHCAKENLLL